MPTTVQPQSEQKQNLTSDPNENLDSDLYARIDKLTAALNEAQADSMKHANRVAELTKELAASNKRAQDLDTLCDQQKEELLMAKSQLAEIERTKRNAQRAQGKSVKARIHRKKEATRQRTRRAAAKDNGGAKPGSNASEPANAPASEAR